jgi:hypothetical protein
MIVTKIPELKKTKNNHCEAGSDKLKGSVGASIGSSRNS